MSKVNRSGETIPRIAFDAAELPARQRFSVWSSSLPSHALALPPGVSPEEFTAKVDVWMLDSITVTHSRLGAFRMARTAEMVRADGLDHVIVILLKSGSVSGTMGDEPFAMGAGQIAFQSLAHAMNVDNSRAESISIRFSRDSLETLIPGAIGLHGAILEGAMTRILADHMQSLIGWLNSIEPREVPSLVTSTLQLIRGTLAAQSNEVRASVEPNVARRIRQYINENLASPNLSPKSICSGLGLSRTSLYRSFPVEGGVQAYIIRRRLEAIHVRLNDPEETRSLANIAFDYGFTSGAHFSRAFKKHFSYAPRDLRGGRSEPWGEQLDGDEAKVALFRRWIDSIR